MLRAALLPLLAAAVLAATAAAAGTPELPTLPSNDVNSKPVSSGVTYAASSFPIALRITPPDGTWFAGQGSIVTVKRGSFGWAEFMHAPPNAPLGAISVISSPDPTPSVAAAVAQLQAGAGATYGPVTPVRLAGFAGSQFDVTIGPKSHVFIPLSPLSHAARFHPDAYRFNSGEVARIIVLDVRGKAVVLLIENAALPADQFPAFLDQAHRLLAMLRFPASA